MYDQLEKGYKIFLTLLSSRKIISAQLSKEENSTVQTLRTRSSASWGPAEAFTINRILRRHAIEMKHAGFNVESIPAITLQKPVSAVPAKTPTSLVRQPARTVTYNGECFEVKYEYNPTLNTEIREIAGKAYNVDKRVWLIPVSQAGPLRIFATRHGFHIGSSAGRLLVDVVANVEASYAFEAVELNIPLKKKLLPFQTAGVAYALKNRRVILADQMGLGKTVQAIAAVTGANLFPCLVISPKSLRFNWKAEWQAWTDKKTHVYTDQIRNHLGYYVNQGVVDVCITHYEGIKKYLIADYHKPKKGPALITLHKSAGLFKSIIIDEAHELRNPNTERFTLARTLTPGRAMVLLLTGTPVVNTVSDLGPLLELVGCISSFGGADRFKATYGALSKRVFETDTGRNGGAVRSASNRLSDLNVKLRAACFIRREKHQVLQELPDKLRQIIPVELDNRAEYDAQLHNLHEYLNSFDPDKPVPTHGGVQAAMLAQIGRLKLLSARGKMHAVFDLVDSIHAAGEKVVVFCWHLETVAAIKAHYLRACVTITGNDTDEEVEAHKKAFQSDKAVNTICVTYKRGGVGHTLTASSKVLFVELGWNHKDMDQAEDRTHRIGQKDTVNCYYFLGRNTIDYYLHEIIEAKRNTANAATGGTEEIETEIGVVAQLIRRFKAVAAAPKATLF